MKNKIVLIGVCLFVSLCSNAQRGEIKVAEPMVITDFDYGKSKPFDKFGDNTIDGYNYEKGFMPLKVGNKYGFKSVTGRIIKPIYDGVAGMNYGMGIVKLNNKYGIIDSMGAVIMKPIFDKLYFNFNGLEYLNCSLEGSEGTVEKNGKISESISFFKAIDDITKLKTSENNNTIAMVQPSIDAPISSDTAIMNGMKKGLNFFHHQNLYLKLLQYQIYYANKLIKEKYIKNNKQIVVESALYKENYTNIEIDKEKLFNKLQAYISQLPTSGTQTKKLVENVNELKALDAKLKTQLKEKGL